MFYPSLKQPKNLNKLKVAKMADNNNNTNPRYDHQMLALALALPFIKMDKDEIRTEFLSDKEAIIKKKKT